MARVAQACGDFPEHRRVTRMRPMVRRARVFPKTIPLAALGLTAGRVRACGLGTAALAVVTAFSLAIIAPKVEWWQFLPIAVCLTGAALMITPSRSMARLRRFSLGLMLMFCGLTLLAVSIGVVDFETLLYGISKLWPGLFVVIGLVLIGKAMQDDLFYFAAAACFAVLLAAATFGFAPPAPLEVIEISPSPFTPRGMF